MFYNWGAVILFVGVGDSSSGRKKLPELPNSGSKCPNFSDERFFRLQAGRGVAPISARILIRELSAWSRRAMHCRLPICDHVASAGSIAGRFCAIAARSKTRTALVRPAASIAVSSRARSNAEPISKMQVCAIERFCALAIASMVERRASLGMMRHELRLVVVTDGLRMETDGNSLAKKNAASEGGGIGPGAVRPRVPI